MPDLTLLAPCNQVKLLLKAGADVLYTNRWGDLAIDDARRVKATPVVELLEPLVEQVCEHVWMCGDMQQGQG